MIEKLEKCPCGEDHHPSECAYMDFANCEEILELEGVKLWGGAVQSDEGDCEPNSVAEIVAFQTGNGECFRLELCVEDMLRLGQYLTRKAFHVASFNDVEPAISPSAVKEYYDEDGAVLSPAQEMVA